jgi:hypothetical protein
VSAEDDPKHREQATDGARSASSGGNSAPGADGPRTERRANARLVLHVPISVTPFSGAEVTGEIRDVSLGGVRFRVDGLDASEGEMLKLAFDLRGVSLWGIGRVLRTRQPGDGGLEISVAFERLDPWAQRHFEEALAEDE